MRLKLPGLSSSMATRALVAVAVGLALFSWSSLHRMQAEIHRLQAEVVHATDLPLNPHSQAGARRGRGVTDAVNLAPATNVAIGARRPTTGTVGDKGRVYRDGTKPCATAILDGPRDGVPRVRHPRAVTVRKRRPRWRLLVFANQRVESLRRLCVSLRRAHVNETVDVTFLLEAHQPTEMYDFVRGFQWPHGQVQVVARHSRGGLINAIIEGWYPANDVEWGVFLEDDIEVSPHFLAYLQAARPLCEAEHGCIGVSLYSPKLNELVLPKVAITAKLERHNAESLYMAQVPCSWGAAYRPGSWRTFRQWAQTQSQSSKYGGDLSLGRGSGWAASWKRYLLELMLVMDWTVMYPYFGNHSAFSTNHLEVGEHITANDLDHRAVDYTHPLLQAPVALSAPQVRFDHLYNTIASRIEDLAIHKSKGLPNRPPTVCDAYSLEGHRSILQDGDGVTVVLTFFYTPNRFMAFLTNIRIFCSYDIVKRVIVMWHNRKYIPQTMAWCKAGSKTSVHFLMPRIKDSLSNRFIPTYRIRTAAVVTVDDDILVSERDMSRMATVLRTSKYSVVVGPFPRWYSERPQRTPAMKYLFNPERGLPVGYPIMLTKIHVSYFALYYHYFCDAAYSEMRSRVAEIRNAEDLLYIRVAADQHVPPTIFVVTADPIDDTGKVGIHSMGGGRQHQEDRSAALDFFGYNDSFWSSLVVLPPGTALSRYSHDMWDRQHALVRE
mmetsp:Transcript_34149/g.102972  ORF Transcript_34149/g.102972 Transcript_34149/m.102972 type:complete len:720 (-) Transcript_34149:733-2892(-)